MSTLTLDLSQFQFVDNSSSLVLIWLKRDRGFENYLKRTMLYYPSIPVLDI